MVGTVTQSLGWLATSRSCPEAHFIRKCHVNNSKTVILIFDILFLISLRARDLEIMCTFIAVLVTIKKRLAQDEPLIL
jgi:hypothetical protein